jgi:S-adenosylmethionine synthetase
VPRTAHLFTSESVSDGHPDKVADQVSDAVLDALLTEDPHARGAIEVLVTRNLCLVAGESRGPRVDVEGIARSVIRDIGYELPGFHWRDVEVQDRVDNQSTEIAAAVDAKDPIGEGAGDQGLMFGFATRETPELMPAALQYAHLILERLRVERITHPGILGPDAKSQVTLEYRNGKPVRAHTVVVSHMHARNVTQEQVRDVCTDAIRATLPAGWLDDATRIFINPSGAFTIGGPVADTGLTGRKIIVDTYGGAAPHGGGAFSGKDPTKVDRSAAYAARYLAKNVVAAGWADRCLIQLAYAIGMPEPVSLFVDCQDTAKVDEDVISACLSRVMPLTPRGIRERLKLDRPIYRPTAAFGHFGRPPDDVGHFSWERTDLVDALEQARKAHPRG